MLTISYDWGKDIKENQRLVRPVKNRLFGKLSTDGITVDYDEKSKRIYGDGDNLDFNYGFKSDDDGYIEDGFVEMPEGEATWT